LYTIDVFISGLNGLGIETVKNLLLAGPHGVTIHDDEKVVLAV
jgi:molybdopterin/thiamine biosynthesis adenylyltransferase